MKRSFKWSVALRCVLQVTAVIAVALMCGVCGKRPEPYGPSECCNRATGSCMLLW